jgi:carboxylesterase
MPFGFPFSLPRLSLRALVPGDGDKSAFFARPARPAPGARGVARAALILHGFSGTPFEVRPIATHLAAHGYAVSAPLLAGHGETVAALATTGWRDWLASAERALAALRAEVDGAPVAIAGFSLGGLLALRLAELYPDAVAALAVMAAPLRLRAFDAAAVRLLGRLPRFLRRGPLAAIPKTRGYDVTDPDMQLRNPGLEAMPVAGAVSLLELGALVRGGLAGVTAPALVVHGELDRTVPLVDSLELVGALGSREIERLWLPRSGHLLAIDVEGRTVVEAIARFFARHVGVGEASPPLEVTT